jgi:hypothetical protein
MNIIKINTNALSNYSSVIPAKAGIYSFCQFNNYVCIRSISRALIICYLIIVSAPVYASFEDTGVGARQIGMGGAFTAIADDVNTIYYNPAGLERLKWMELSTFTGKLYEGLSDNSSLGNNFMAFAYPLYEQGTAGFSWLNFSLAGYYSESTFTFGYARRIKDPLNSGLLSMGLNIKILSRTFSKTAYTENGVNLDTGYVSGGTDPVFENGYTTAKLGVDFGLLYSPMFMPEHSFALVIRNVNDPDIGFESRDNIGREVKLGYAYSKRYLNFAVDLSMERNGMFVSVGSELLFLGGIYGLRGGYTAGSDESSRLSCGAMFRYNDMFQLDYGFSLPVQGITGVLGTHRISLIFRFGPNVPITVDRSRQLKVMENRVDSIMEKVQRIDSSEDVPDIRKVLEKAQGSVNKIKQDIKISEQNQKELIEKYYRDGLVEYSNGNIGKAIWNWESALQLDPGNEKVRNALEQAKKEQEK